MMGEQQKKGDLGVPVAEPTVGVRFQSLPSVEDFHLPPNARNQTTNPKFTMSKRTDREVAVQIAALKLERAMLPERSMFGTDNWKMIDAKIAILEDNFDEDLTAEESMDEYGDEGIMDLEMTESWRDGADCDPPCGDEDLITQAENTIPQ